MTSEISHVEIGVISTEDTLYIYPNFSSALPCYWSAQTKDGHIYCQLDNEGNIAQRWDSLIPDDIEAFWLCLPSGEKFGISRPDVANIPNCFFQVQETPDKIHYKRVHLFDGESIKTWYTEIVFGNVGVVVMVYPDWKILKTFSFCKQKGLKQYFN